MRHVSAFECVGGFVGELLKNCKPRIPRLLSQDRPGEDCGKRIDALTPHACYLITRSICVNRTAAGIYFEAM